MRSKLKLKEKSEERIVYAYSCNESVEIIDGEIEYNFAEDDFYTLKLATNDEGGYAEWLYPHIHRAIFREGCPVERYIATG